LELSRNQRLERLITFRLVILHRTPTVSSIPTANTARFELAEVAFVATVTVVIVVVAGVYCPVFAQRYEAHPVSGWTVDPSS